jgi:hypothetical protein
MLTLFIGQPIGLLLIIGAGLPLFGLETPTGYCSHCRTLLTQNWLGRLALGFGV